MHCYAKEESTPDELANSFMVPYVNVSHNRLRLVSCDTLAAHVGDTRLLRLPPFLWLF